jgi:hypothetical protein
MNEKDLLMLGSVPLDTPEEVFQVCGRTIGEYLPWMPDGETDERIWWVNMLAYCVYHGHPDIETVRRPPPTTMVSKNGNQRTAVSCGSSESNRA